MQFKNDEFRMAIDYLMITKIFEMVSGVVVVELS